jgi:GTP pyrophosphokinase
MAYLLMHIKQLQQFFDYRPFVDDPQKLVDEIMQQARRYLPGDQLPLIQQTYEYARAAHGDQVRLSGEIYITHPLKATVFLMDMKPDIATIQACMLHDVIEDTDLTYDDIQREFGEEVAILCEGLVKVSTIKYRGEERQLETIKKTFLAMAHDLRVIFIKIVDRIHNIQTLHFHPKPEKRRRIAQETMMIYVSIAKRLGLYRYQLLLENGAFMILHPEECTKIMHYLQRNFGTERTYIQRGQRKIEMMLRKEKIPYYFVKGRVKSPYRIFEKIERKQSISTIAQVLDIIAFRVVTHTT